MLETVLIVYDDTVTKSEIIQDVIGNKGFADVVVRKKKLEKQYLDTLLQIYPEAICRVLHSVFEFEELDKELFEITEEQTKVLHCFSNYIFLDEKQALLSFMKLSYIDEPYLVVMDKKTVALMFPNIETYLTFTRELRDIRKTGSNFQKEVNKSVKEHFFVEGMVDIGIVSNFIQCITGNFEARYFNSLEENEYTVIKRSINKKKIKMEYCYYQMLPEEMKSWFVMPFRYQEDMDSASYTMERLHMTDIGIKWVHGSFALDEFEELLDKYFYFFENRNEKTVTQKEYQIVSDQLYCDKVQERISELKKLPDYASIACWTEASQCVIDDLHNQYLQLKEKIEAKSDFKLVSVIGHGDPCFSNALYNKPTKTLKFIDPKGALVEDELWTNPYYDIAKLSHSICGLYDFFNSGLFEIKIDELLKLKLQIEFDNTAFVEIFRRKLLQHGYDYLTVRLYEASLFLSMLPLHMDAPYKVLGFILNARDILEEVEESV